MLRDAGIGVEPIHAADPEGHPEVALAVFDDRGHVIASDRRRLGRIVTVDPDGVPVVPIQAVVGRDPDEAPAILIERVDRIAGQSVARVDMAKDGHGRPRAE